MEPVNPNNMILGKDYYIELNLPSKRGSFVGFKQGGIMFSDGNRYNRNENNYYDVKTNELVNQNHLMEGTQYIIKAKGKKIGTFAGIELDNAKFQNIRQQDGSHINVNPRFRGFPLTEHVFYEVKKPDIMEASDKRLYNKAYDNVLNSLSREDTTTGKRVNEYLGHKEFTELHKMFAGKRKRKSKRQKSKRRKSYRRRKSRKNKR